MSKTIKRYTKKKQRGSEIVWREKQEVLGVKNNQTSPLFCELHPEVSTIDTKANEHKTRRKGFGLETSPKAPARGRVQKPQ